MQRRLHINSLGPCGLLQAEALKFWRDWCGKKPQTEADLYQLIEAAVRPEALLPRGFTKSGVVPADIDPLSFCRCYYLAPDFVLQFMAALRRIYFKPSKQQQLQNFLAETPLVFRTRNPRKPLDFVYGKELADRFNVETDGDATGKDIEAARRRLAARLREGAKLSKKLARKFSLKKSREA